MATRILPKGVPGSRYWEEVRVCRGSGLARQVCESEEESKAPQWEEVQFHYQMGWYNSQGCLDQRMS